MIRRLHPRDVGIAYGVIVTVLCLIAVTAPDSVRTRLVDRSSTNLANLHQHPVYVLVISAFIEPGLLDLVLVIPLVLACFAVQRWLGRSATIVSLVLAHVGATLFVATLLSAGITHGTISRSVVHAQDVGVSYALVGLLGLLTARARRRRWYALAGTVVVVSVLLLDQTFTDLGHVTAWLIGLGLATLATPRVHGLAKESSRR